MAFPAVAPNASKLPYAIRLTGWRLAGAVAGNGLMVAVALFLGIGAVGNPRPVSAIMALVYLALLALGVYGALRLWRLKDPEVELFPDRLERPGLLARAVLNRADIEGVSRTITTRSGSYFNVIALPGRGRSVTFAGSLRSDPVFAEWLAGAPDPDVVEKDADRARVLADDRYGATASERSARLAWARRAVIAFSVACAALALWLGFFDAPRPVAVMAAAACIAGGYLLVHLFQGLVIWWPRTGVRPSTVAAFAPAAAVAVRGLITIHLLRSEPLLIGGAAAGLAAAVILLQLNQGAPRRLQTALGLGVFAGFLAYGAGAYVDALSAARPESSYVVAVQGKHVSRGRSTTYYLDLDAWGDQPAKEVAVPSALYGSVEPGARICIDRFRGDLGLPWFDLGLCKTRAGG